MINPAQAGAEWVENGLKIARSGPGRPENEKKLGPLDDKWQIQVISDGLARGLNTFWMNDERNAKSSGLEYFGCQRNQR